MSDRLKVLNPARVMALGFMGLILSGSILLSLPPMTEESGIAYIDALFTATSAVCVTGLVVVDTGTYFTLLGQTVIMVLIFCGSLAIGAGRFGKSVALSIGEADHDVMLADKDQTLIQ